MNKQQEQLSIIIPAYKGLKYLIKNEIFWKEITDYIGAENIYLIEDSLEEEMKEFANNIKWNYFSKENGSKNSVINYAVKNVAFKTRYVKIVDVDDILDITELQKMVEFMIENKTFGFIYAHGNNVWNDGLIQKWNENSFRCLGYWPSVEVFKKLPTLPLLKINEDQFLTISIETLSADHVIVPFYPYSYAKGNLGSLDNPKVFDYEYIVGYIVFAQLFDFVSKNFTSIKQEYLKKQYNSVQDLLTFIHWGLRWKYDKGLNHISRKNAIETWKIIKRNNKKKYKCSIDRLFIWSKLYILFTFKWLKK